MWKICEHSEPSVEICQNVSCVTFLCNSGIYNLEKLHNYILQLLNAVRYKVPTDISKIMSGVNFKSNLV